MYVIVREDLTPTYHLIQAAHAAHEAGIRYGNSKKTSSLVICTVPDEGTLRLTAANASLNGIRNYMFTEEDIDNQATAFATEPIHGDKRRFFRKFPLWKPMEAQMA